MYLALTICVLFISLMQSVNGAQFLNTTSLHTLYELSPACCATDIVPLTTIYASLKSHKLDFNIEILNSILLSLLNVPHVLSFISTHFFPKFSPLIWCIV